MKLIHAKEGMRFFSYSLKRRWKGIKRYDGTAQDICTSIIDDCWNGRYFQTSAGHYCEFYTRDFGMCVPSLMKLGYSKKVQQTLQYALNIFQKHGHVTTGISPKQQAFDFPYYGPDSFAFLLWSLRHARAKPLVKRYQTFLQRMADEFQQQVIAPDTGFVREDKYFSSMRDYAKRKSSCYDNVMVAVVQRELKKLGIRHELAQHNLTSRIKQRYWTGEYFLDDLESKHIAGDANVVPFFLDLFTTKMQKQAFDVLHTEQLHKPYPLKYVQRKGTSMHVLEILVPGWQHNAIWGHLGMMYLSLLKHSHHVLFEHVLEDYEHLVSGQGNFLEVLTHDGKPYKSLFYHTDVGMIWSSILLRLLKEHATIYRRKL